MFVIMTQGIIKEGEAEALNRVTNEEMIPFFKRQKGFVQYLEAVSTDDPNHSIGFTIWDSLESALAVKDIPESQTIGAKIFTHYVKDLTVTTYNSVAQS